jgi:hypothetical protein
LSPFHVVEEFISPLHCERISKELALRVPNFDENGGVMKYKRDLPTEILYPLLEELNAQIPELEQRYDAQIVPAGTQSRFVQYFEDQKRKPEEIGCENSVYARKKWTKVKDFDLVGFLWLKDYNNSVPLDPRTEVYGGKLEFPAWGYSLTPARGTLVIYPAGPNFITSLSHVMFGTLEMVKFGFKLSQDGEPYVYDKSKHPGTFTEWFA